MGLRTKRGGTRTSRFEHAGPGSNPFEGLDLSGGGDQPQGDDAQNYPGYYTIPKYDPFGNVVGYDYMRVPESLLDQEGGGSAMRSAELQYQLGLKGIEVDWARVGNERERTAIERGGLAESVRSNKAQEAEQRRMRALDAASQAVSAYLRGTELADARRLSAFQESRALLPSLVSPDQKFFAGQEPGGTLATAAERFGLPFTGSEVQHKQLVPSSLATPPTGGQVGSEVIDYINQVKGAGNA